MQAIVLDANGLKLSPTSQEKALRLLRDGKATLVAQEPLTIQLIYAVHRARVEPSPQPAAAVGQGQRLLLHICCAPCSTYSIKRLRELAFDVTGYWYNPNVHPFGEHERRREALVHYGSIADLPILWETAYEMVDWLRATSGREQLGQRCQICYRMRMERVAGVAAREGFDAFTTTLLISPYQDQTAIRAIGDEAARRYGVAFYFDNLRRGWAEHFQMTRDAALYSQRYCGCVYSEWEARDRQAITGVKR
jgi:predicted adenine nucleotide alpha hydrolase (AANH) superfamily ATPase